MSLNDILLTVAALVPALVLCVYVYIKDRVEKEPLGVLIALLFGGVVICFPAAIIETIADEFLLSFFSGIAEGLDDYTVLTYIYVFCSNFFGIALVEEGLKWLVLIIVASNTRHFNSLFDGIIYAVFVSLGFAAFENVLYVLEYGWANAVLRAVLSVPAHAFFGVIMGYYYSFYHITKQAHNIEKQYKSAGILNCYAKEFNESVYLILSIAIPFSAHGFYNFCCSIDSWIATISLLAFVAFLYIYCFGRIKNMSRLDIDDKSYVTFLLYKKYPGLPVILENLKNPNNGGY